MSDAQKETQEDRVVPFDLTSCMAMMEEMIGQQRGGCGCTQMMSRMAGQGSYPEMMSRTMASCCTVPGESEETTSTDTIQET